MNIAYYNNCIEYYNMMTRVSFIIFQAGSSVTIAKLRGRARTIVILQPLFIRNISVVTCSYFIGVGGQKHFSGGQHHTQINNTFHVCDYVGARGLHATHCTHVENSTRVAIEVFVLQAYKSQLTSPAVSVHFQWTAQQVVSLAGQGAL